MEKLKKLILKPMTTLEEKADFKKIGILLACMVGVLFVGKLGSYLYIMRDVPVETDYFKYTTDFLLDQVAFLGSIFVGVYVLCTLLKKKFDLAKVCRIILVSFSAYYLLQAVTSLVFMFDFMDIKFLVAVKNALLSAANYFSYLILVFVISKEYNIGYNEKGLWNWAIIFFVIFAVRNILYLIY